MRFENRQEAGRELAAALQFYAGRDNVIVLALPRGGVPVAAEIARALGAPIDVFVVRKLGLPGQEELAMGAIASGGLCILNEEVLHHVSNPDRVVEEVSRREMAELERREKLYRGDRPFPDLRGKTILLIDDGLATGSTMRAAARAVRSKDPARIVIAVPVGASATCHELRADADEVVCIYQPAAFYAVGQAYDDFAQTTDEEVRAFLSQAAGD